MAPSVDGERAGPLAKMILGAKHEGRPPILSHMIVHELFECSLTVLQRCFTLPQELENDELKMYWIRCNIN